MAEADRHSHLPDTDRMSVLIAMILLAYALAHYINLPIRELSIQLPGFYISFPFGVQELVALLVAVMTSSGADWLLHSHPHLQEHLLIEHWLLPGVTAWAIGLPLMQLPISPAWWIGFTLGGCILILVLVAEYIVVDPNDIRQPLASAGLTAVAFALYLVLAAALRFNGPRLFLIIPALGLAVFMVSLRCLRLRLSDHWAFVEAGLITLITIQIATPLHYWPLSPVSFGLILLGPAYALTNFFGNLAEGEATRRAIVEPTLVLAIIWTAAVIIR